MMCAAVITGARAATLVMVVALLEGELSIVAVIVMRPADVPVWRVGGC